jgi:phenylalanyl-tRNA synthetase beta chain
MLFGALETINFNSNRKNSSLKLFETGKVYSKNDDKYIESTILSLVLTGNQNAESWNTTSTKEDYFRLKGAIEALFNQLGIAPAAKDLSENTLVSKGIQYLLNTKNIAFIGTVKPAILKEFDISNEVFYAQIILDDIYKPVSNNKIEFNEISKFPEVRRDLALLLDEKITFEQIVEVARKSEKSLLKDINLFDVYQGKNLEAGKKSYAVSFTLLDNQATLNEKQIDKVMSKLIKAYQDELGAILRG